MVRARIGVQRRTHLRFRQDLERQPRLIRADGERHGVVLVASDERPGLRLVIRERLGVLVGQPQVSLERPTDDGLVAGDAVRAGVGQRDDSEVPFGHGEQLSELADGRPAVPDRSNAVHVAQEPADADSVAQRAGSQRSSRLLHPLQHFGGQNLDTALRPAVTEMEPGPPKLVRRRGDDARARVTAAWAPP